VTRRALAIAAVVAAVVGAALVPAGALEGALGWQGAVALATALVLAWGAWARRRGREEARAPVRDALLAALAVAALFLWLAPSGLQFGRFVHVWDAYHYYLGAKYFRELGYERIYDCTLVADAESGYGRLVRRGGVRNLRTRLIKPAREVLADPGACKEHFTPERWAEFKHDVGWFRERHPPAEWLSLRTDHGYNAPPTWGMLGTLLTDTGPASRGQIGALILLDPLLLAAMFAVVACSFGWRVACVAGIFLGTNHFANWSWVGGSILRYDWLCAAVVGICLLRRARPAAAGGFLAYAAAVRIFPIALLAALALRAGVRRIGAWRFALDPEERRLLAGALGAALLLFAGATAVAGGVAAWPAFVANSRAHLGTPLNNYAGLRTVLSYDHATREAVVADHTRRGDPYLAWREARRATFAGRAAVFWILAAAYVALLAAALRGQPEWIAAVLGVGSIAVLFELTGYYHAILLAFAFLWPAKPWIGVGLLLLAAASRGIASLGLPDDEIFFWTSLLTLTLVVGATASFVDRSAWRRT
jgi:hypothetical protein